MKVEIVGTLDGPFGPFLAKGRAGFVVLRRARAEPWASVGTARLAEPFDRVEVAGRAFDVEPFVPGTSLAALKLEDADARVVLREVARALAPLHATGTAHGALGLGSVRIDPTGCVRLVGLRGGAPEADREALVSMAEVLYADGAVPADVAEALRAAAPWLALADVAPADRVEALQHWGRVDGGAVETAAHELSGATSSDGMASLPPKVQMSLVAGVTLLLGLLAGALLAGCGSAGPPAQVTVHVVGAIHVQVYCGGGQTHRSESGVTDTLTFAPEGVHCLVEAPLTPVIPLRGPLELSAATHYVCEREGVRLACREG